MTDATEALKRIKLEMKHDLRVRARSSANEVLKEMVDYNLFVTKMTNLFIRDLPGGVEHWEEWPLMREIINDLILEKYEKYRHTIDRVYPWQKPRDGGVK
jgi:hypothetical protein